MHADPSTQPVDTDNNFRGEHVQQLYDDLDVSTRMYASFEQRRANIPGQALENNHWREPRTW